jgi:hypothetical protein
LFAATGDWWFQVSSFDGEIYTYKQNMGYHQTSWCYSVEVSNLLLDLLEPKWIQKYFAERLQYLGLQQQFWILKNSSSEYQPISPFCTTSLDDFPIQTSIIGDFQASHV